MAADGLDEKTSSGEGRTMEQQRKGSISEGDLETVLGYKPELERNRTCIDKLTSDLCDCR